SARTRDGVVTTENAYGRSRRRAARQGRWRRARRPHRSPARRPKAAGLLSAISPLRSRQRATPRVCRRSRRRPFPLAHRAVRRSGVIFDVGEALVFLGSPLERAALLARLPVHHFLDLLRELE